MADWGPVVIAVVLFVLLSPGLLFQLPGRSRIVEFGNMQTSGLSILVHTIIFFGLITIILIAIGSFHPVQRPLSTCSFDNRPDRVAKDWPSVLKVLKKTAPSFYLLYC
ncbi:hypothetical protein ACH5RR_030855 [Cinchona calisaya]|uniref:Uncharacterized protein n=1 Tax=Cinchona calisaya TaxID=153742 RepID=A0ABD2YVV7_9GENT